MPHVGLFPKEFAPPEAFLPKKNLLSPSISLASSILLSYNLYFFKLSLIVYTNKMLVPVCPFYLSHRDGIIHHGLEILLSCDFVCSIHSLP